MYLSASKQEQRHHTEQTGISCKELIAQVMGMRESHQGPARQPNISNSREPATLQLKAKEEEAELKGPPSWQKLEALSCESWKRQVCGWQSGILPEAERKEEKYLYLSPYFCPSISFQYLLLVKSAGSQDIQCGWGVTQSRAQEGRVRRMLRAQAWHHTMHY